MMHASATGPDPANMSSTVPPGGVTSRTAQEMNPSGFTVSCAVPSSSRGLSLAGALA